MLSRTKDFVKFCDQVGKEPSLSFNGSTKIKTFCGGVLTFMITTFIAATSYFFSKEIYLRQDPAIRTSSVPLSESIILPKAFPLALNIADGRGNDLTFDPGFNRAVLLTAELREISHAAYNGKMRIYTYKMKRCNILEFGELGQVLENLDKKQNPISA